MNTGCGTADDNYNDDMTPSSDKTYSQQKLVDANQEGDFCGAEHFLIGLSPQYWSHTPLSIGDLRNLVGLVDGVDCMVIKAVEHRPRNSPTSTGIKKPVSATFLPLSKVMIQGIIVNVERKSNGSVMYIIDDGTGMIDCVAWLEDDFYSLPPLLERQLNDSDCEKTFGVGELVCIMGKIKCVSVGEVRETLFVCGRNWEVHDCIREINVTIIEAVDFTREVDHWIRCLQFAKRAMSLLKSERGELYSDKEGKTNDMDDTFTYQRRPLNNGAHVLKMLGPDISTKITEENESYSGESLQSLTLFGVGCRCSVPYKHSLLYCHCQATKEALDPQLVFRDALLLTLLKMENEFKLRDNADITAMEDMQLHFQYRSLVDDENLQLVAHKVLSESDHPSSNSRRLYVNTFRSLRKDGIIYLEETDTDTYLLISCNRVLEPYLKKISGKDGSTAFERRMLRIERPCYLSNVPSSRIQYVKKSLSGNGA